MTAPCRRPETAPRARTRRKARPLDRASPSPPPAPRSIAATRPPRCTGAAVARTRRRPSRTFSWAAPEIAAAHAAPDCSSGSLAASAGSVSVQWTIHARSAPHALPVAAHLAHGRRVGPLQEVRVDPPAASRPSPPARPRCRCRSSPPGRASASRRNRRARAAPPARSAQPAWPAVPVATAPARAGASRRRCRP